MGTPILTPELIKKYGRTRLFGSNVSPDDVNRIELHNAVLPSRLEKILGEITSNYVRVIQENSREPIYFHREGDEGILSIPQHSGFGRRTRYEEMIEAYVQASKRSIEFRSLELDQDENKTNMFYGNYAYDFVTGLFVPLSKYEHKRVFKEKGMENVMGGVSTVIIGPTEAVSRKAEVVTKGESEYLDSQIIKTNNGCALNVGYVYADQAATLIRMMTSVYEAKARNSKKKLDIKVFMFGRVAGLMDDMEINDLICPIGIIDEDKLYNNSMHFYPINNYFADTNKPDSLILNVLSVINENEEQLRLAKEKGCHLVDMENRAIVAELNMARLRHAERLSIEYGFIGHISDLPLHPSKTYTLAHEGNTTPGEDKAVDKILNVC